MMRLEAVDRDLSEKLNLASPAQQQAASVAACQFALQATSVEVPLVLESLEQLRQHGILPTHRVAELNDLAEQLDSEYFRLQDQAEDDPHLQAAALRLFGQARAIAAVAFAGDKDGVKAVMEAIYEASVTVDDGMKVFNIARRALSEHQS
ncbi:MAG: hypothetical protein ACOVOD_16455 [Rhodoferax sp.]